MRKFVFNKLVRDNIVALQTQDGGSADYKILDNKEFVVALKEKLLEEAKEIYDEGEESLLSEIADLQELIDNLIEAIGKSKTELAAAQAKKNAKQGSFKKRMFVNTVSLPDDYEWVEYFLKNSDRYPELKD